MIASEALRSGFNARLGPSGVHLFDRESGVNVLLDEIEVPESSWARAPRQMSVALTNACDLRCSYCFAPKHRALLPYGKILSWLAELDANGAHGIGFGGGEPTLHPRFADLCAHAAKNSRLAVTFTTHAHRFTEDLAAQLVGNVHFVRVSMDGVGATYERLRGRSFSAFRDQLRLIRQVAMFGFNYVVNRDSVDELDLAVTVACDEGAAEVLLLPQQPTECSAGIDAQTVRRLHAWIAQYEGPVRLAISAVGSEGIATCDPLPRERGLRSYAHITADGVLKRTSFDFSGVSISAAGVMSALSELEKEEER